MIMNYLTNNILPYIFVVLLLGTFTALVGGAKEVIEYGIVYLFWMGMLAPALIPQKKEEYIIPIKYPNKIS